MDLDTRLIIPFGLMLIIASVNDWRFQKIPNVLTYPAMVAGITYHTLASGTKGLLFSVEGLGLGLGIMIIPYLLGAMGAGTPNSWRRSAVCLAPGGGGRLALYRDCRRHLCNDDALLPHRDPQEI